MKREEHKEIIQKMLTMVNPDNQANASELLTQLSDDYEQTLTSLETANTNVQELTVKNETLRDVNAKLFLKVGSTDNKPPQGNNENTNNQGEDNKDLTFDKLFNEKGELL